MNNPQRAKQGTPLTSVFYTELVFVAINVILCGYGILQPRVSFLLWLPCLLLLCAACISLSSLIYLNKGISMKSKKDLLLYVLLTLVLVIFRIFCFCLLAIGLFAPHAVPGISSIVGAVVLFHAVYGLYAIGRATVLRMGMDKRMASKDSRVGAGVEEIAIISLASNPRALSQATLITNLDEADLVSTVKP